MSAEGLRSAVLDKARREAGQLLAQARAAAEQEGRQAEEQSRREAAAILEQARLEAAREREQALAALQREQRLQTLAAKNQLLEQAFARAAEGFRSLPAERLRELYRAELASIDLQDASLRVPPGTKAEFETLLGGRRARVEEDPALEAGYIVVRSDFRLDRSLAARLAEIRAEMRLKIAQLLFDSEA
jgi:V/A-type H+-transporting ATPase subunit E